VSKGKHRRSITHKALPLALIVLAVLALTGGGATYAALRYDRSHADQILPGVTIDGVDVGGMTRDQAISTVSSKANTALTEGISIRAGGKHWSATPEQLGVRADVAGAVDQALALDDGLGVFSRVMHRLRHEPLGKDIPLGLRYAPAKVKAFVASISGDVGTAPTNASVTLEADQLRFVHAKTGRTLDTKAAATRILAALKVGTPTISLPIAKVQPKVPDSKLGKTIVVQLSNNTLYLYDGFKVIRTYPVATAMPAYTTPVGVWSVVSKQENPTWYNPAPDTWGAGLPPSIPPGPGNPLGTRALYLNAPGIRIHGTYDSGSIGTYASHGCIRMNIADVEALYPLVPIGTRVIIR
jgi:lipoprotein-anchoring transpeptidase ErfK/SrfK